MKFLNIQLPARYNDYGLLILRLAFGLCMIYGHGWGKGCKPGVVILRDGSSSGPSINVSPSSVNLGGEMVIRGSGFPPLSGLHIRWFSTSSISYELGRNVPTDENGELAAGGPMENPGFCGAGTVAVFTESGSSFEVPRFSEALATAPAVVRC